MFNTKFKYLIKTDQSSMSCPNLTISGRGQPDIIIIDTDGILLRDHFNTTNGMCMKICYLSG